jgi:hypothetical protein
VVITLTLWPSISAGKCPPHYHHNPIDKRLGEPQISNEETEVPVGNQHCSLNWATILSVVLRSSRYAFMAWFSGIGSIYLSVKLEIVRFNPKTLKHDTVTNRIILPNGRDLLLITSKQKYFIEHSSKIK